MTKTSYNDMEDLINQKLSYLHKAQTKLTQFTGNAIVVFECPQEAIEVLDFENQSLRAYANYYLPCGCFAIAGPLGNSISFESAPEPTDIIWENFEISKCQRFNKMLCANLSVIFLLALSFGILFGVNIAKGRVVTAEEKAEQLTEDDKKDAILS